MLGLSASELSPVVFTHLIWDSIKINVELNMTVLLQLTIYHFGNAKINYENVVRKIR